MNSASLIRLIQQHQLRIFTTADFKTLSGLEAAAATVALSRLAKNDLVMRIKRGVWVNKLAADLNPYEAIPYLRAPWPAYVSLYSALSDYGVIEEIPHVVYGVSSAATKTYNTTFGEFRIHRLPSRLVWGSEVKQAGRGSYLIADREKAFLDLVYLALTRRSPLRLPHKRERRWELDRAKLTAYARRFDFEPLKAWLKANALWQPGNRVSPPALLR